MTFEGGESHEKVPETLDYDLAKIWLAKQDLSDCMPEQIKEMFLDQLRKLEAVNVERWD